MIEKLKQEHLDKKHNENGYFNKDCILCVNRRNGNGVDTPPSLGVDVKEEVVSDEAIG